MSRSSIQNTLLFTGFGLLFLLLFYFYFFSNVPKETINTVVWGFLAVGYSWYLYDGLFRHKYYPILLSARLHPDEKSISLFVAGLLTFLLVAIVIVLNSALLTLTNIIPFLAFVLILLNIWLRAKSNLEFSGKGIRQFRYFIRWEDIESFSWTGPKYDYLTLKLKRRVWSATKWRIDPRDGQAVSDFLYQQLATLQMLGGHEFQPE